MVFHDRVSDHAAGHGQELLRLAFDRSIGENERAGAAQAHKRKMCDADLVFFTVTCRPEQMVLFPTSRRTQRRAHGERPWMVFLQWSSWNSA